MVKELRSSLRGAKFFIAHLTILSIFACVLLIVFSAKMVSGLARTGEYGGDPSHVGREVFLWTQLLHLVVVFLVVPSLAATSITGEREQLTHELLLSTTMSARQIVWGKFTAAMTQTFTIFVSLVPLVGLCFLFGGITIYQIAANYAFLFGLSALVIAFALNISAGAKSTQRAVGTVYTLAILGSVLAGVVVAAGGAKESPFIIELGIAYGFVSRGADFGRPIGFFERVMYVHVMPGFAWTTLLALFFIGATNRLKPLFANRSTAIRIFFVVAILAGGLLTILTFYHELPPAESGSPHRTDSRSVAVMGFAISALTIALLSSLFACEDPILPPHLDAEVSALRKRPLGRMLAWLWPGATSGAKFSIAFNAFFLTASFAVFIPFSRGFNRGSWSGRPEVLPTVVALGSALLWAWFTATYARFLGISLASRPVLLRAILVLTCLFLAIFPVVHWAIADSIEPDEHDVLRRSGPWTLGLSPAAAIVSALDLSSGRRSFPVNAGTVPIPLAFAVVSLVAGTVFLVLGNRAERRLLSELANLREKKHFE
jgi:ABC-type transport system involved in multi-copper enzyme maturation permease subunit